jgi:hypothetical protein
MPVFNVGQKVKTVDSSTVQKGIPAPSVNPVTPTPAVGHVATYFTAVPRYSPGSQKLVTNDEADVNWDDSPLTTRHIVSGLVTSA